MNVPYAGKFVPSFDVERGDRIERIGNSGVPAVGMTEAPVTMGSLVLIAHSGANPRLRWQRFPNPSGGPSPAVQGWCPAKARSRPPLVRHRVDLTPPR